MSSSGADPLGFRVSDGRTGGVETAAPSQPDGQRPNARSGRRSDQRGGRGIEHSRVLRWTFIPLRRQRMEARGARAARCGVKQLDLFNMG